MLEETNRNGTYSVVHYRKDEHLFLARRRIWNKGDSYHSLQHEHAEMELLQVKDGGMECMVDGQNVFLNKGDVLFINSLHMHASELGSHDHCHFNVLLIHPDAFPSTQIVSPFFQAVISRQGKAYLHFPAGEEGTVLLGQQISSAVETSEEKKPGWQLEMLSLACGILRQLWLREESVNVNAESNDALVLNHMVDYIYSHYPEHLHLNDIAMAGGTSASRCSRIFQSHTGHSPVDFLIRYRLEAACSLLRTSDLPVAEISAQCGFEQPSYFNRQFRSVMGCTPNDYRKNPNDLYIH